MIFEFQNVIEFSRSYSALAGVLFSSTWRLTVSNLPIFVYFCHPIFAHKNTKKAAEAAVLWYLSSKYKFRCDRTICTEIQGQRHGVLGPPLHSTTLMTGTTGLTPTLRRIARLTMPLWTGLSTMLILFPLKVLFPCVNAMACLPSWKLVLASEPIQELSSAGDEKVSEYRAWCNTRGNCWSVSVGSDREWPILQSISHCRWIWTGNAVHSRTPCRAGTFWRGRGTVDGGSKIYR